MTDKTLAVYALVRDEYPNVPDITGRMLYYREMITDPETYPREAYSRGNVASCLRSLMGAELLTGIKQGNTYSYSLSVSLPNDEALTILKEYWGKNNKYYRDKDNYVSKQGARCPHCRKPLKVFLSKT
jgi:hypothetical protein